MRNKDLETLLPGVEVMVAGKSMTIQPFSFVKIPKAIALAGKLGKLLIEVMQVISVKSTGLEEMEVVDLVVFAAERGITVPEEAQVDIETCRAFVIEQTGVEPEIGLKMEGNKISFTEGTFEAVTSLFEHGGNNLFELIKLGACKDQKWLESLNSAEGFDVTLAIIEVNLDFFKKRLSPLLAGRMAELVKKI